MQKGSKPNELQRQSSSTTTLPRKQPHGFGWFLNVLFDKIDNFLKLLGKMIGVQFASVKVPWLRRCQTFAVLVTFSVQFVFIVVGLLLLKILSGWYLAAYLAYLGWAYFIDKSPVRGGRRSIIYRKLTFWNWFRDYFPIYLMKTQDLDKSRNYVFGYHPHGIIGMGAVCNFATEANRVSELFPGIVIKVLTLAVNFKIPFFREHLLMMGLCDVSKESCDYILNSGPGQSILIVIGGAAEALDARPNSYDLTLKDRKGFVKVALRHGADLVPVLGFGENDLFEQISNPRGSPLRHLQHTLQKKLGFSLPLFHGRGVFNYTFGFMPFRKPLHSVVGTAIRVEKKIPDPTPAEVDKYHALYMNELDRMYKEHRKEYAPQSDETIHFY